MLKKVFHKFFINEKGAVSLYLIIIALVLLLFNAVLIDYARILVAERQTEEAANTAIRSTMASYDKNLQDKGVFGFNGNSDEAERTFKQTFAKNLVPQDEGEMFNLLGLEPVRGKTSLDLDMDRVLAEEEILDYQILEEMKYKAPVEVGEAIIRDFLSVAEQVEDASDYADVASDINDIAEDREDMLEDAKELIEDANSILNSNVTDLVLDETPQSEYPRVDLLNDIIVHYGTFKEEIEAIEEAEEAEEEDGDSDDGEDDEDEEHGDEEEDEKSVDDMKDDTDTFKSEAKDLLKNINDHSNDAYDKIVEALDLIDDAKDKNEEIKDTIENQTDNSDYDEAREAAEDAGEGSMSDEDMQSSFKDYVLDDDMFTDVDEKLNDSMNCLMSECSTGGDASVSGLIPSADSLKNAVNNDFRNKGKSSVSGNIDDAGSALAGSSDGMTDALDILEDGRKEFEENEAEIEDEEDKADEKMDENEDYFDDEIYDKIDAAMSVADDSGTYAYLEDAVKKYGDYKEANSERFSAEDADKTSKEATSFVDTLFSGIGDALLSARDRVYINEYMLLRFSHHDFDKNGAEAYAYENNQIEYLIYGKHKYGENFALAMSEIFAVRFVINLATGFMRKEGNVFGPLKWAYALSFAVGQTVIDMYDINNGDPVSLIAGESRPLMTYKDHLRLFLFAHPNGDTKPRLMAALDEEELGDNTDDDLRDRSTYASATATSSVNLWFLPQIADMLDKTGILNGEVEDGKFKIEKEVNYSY